MPANGPVGTVDARVREWREIVAGLQAELLEARGQRDRFECGMRFLKHCNDRIAERVAATLQTADAAKAELTRLRAHMLIEAGPQGPVCAVCRGADPACPARSGHAN